MYIYIEVDTNDGDYIGILSRIKNETLKKIMPVIEAIKDFKPYKNPDINLYYEHDHNFPTGDCLRSDLGEKSSEELYGHLEGYEAFCNFLPYYEYGFHTITEINILTLKENLL